MSRFVFTSSAAALIEASAWWRRNRSGHLLALERGVPGRRYVLCGEVASFGRGPGSALSQDAGTFARRSEVYGRLPPVRVDDAGARALGFAPRGVEEGLAATAAWIGKR